MAVAAPAITPAAPAGLLTQDRHSSSPNDPVSLGPAILHAQTMPSANFQPPGAFPLKHIHGGTRHVPLRARFGEPARE